MEPSSPGLTLLSSEALVGALSLAMDREFPAWGVLLDPGPAPEWPFFEKWLDEGRHGSLSYMERTALRRREMRLGYPGMRTLIIALLPHDPRSMEEPPAEKTVRIARYAIGPDYHLLFEQAFGRVLSAVQSFLPSGEAPLIKADHGALLEKSLARRAGLGAIGKNTLLIRPGSGSYFTIGSLLLRTPLPARIGPYGASDICGGCSRCIAACPTGALEAPYRLDARRCLSYLTIERPGEDREGLRRDKGGGWLFGCDLCQEVCPYNASTSEKSGERGLGVFFVDPGSSLEDLGDLRREHGALSRVSRSRLARRLQEINGG